MTTIWQKLPENKILVAGLTVLALILMLSDANYARAALYERVGFATIYTRLAACPSVACKATQGVVDTIGRYLPTLESAALTLRG